MPGDVNLCRASSLRCLDLATRARSPMTRTNLITMAELWSKLAAEEEFDQSILGTLSQLELGEPRDLLPLALNLTSSAA